VTSTIHRAQLVTQIPSVDRVLNLPQVQQWAGEYGRTMTGIAVRETIDEIRRDILEGVLIVTPADAQLLARIRQHLDQLARPQLRPVFNLTGTVLHTNLGRALLPQAAINAIANAATQACTLEYDLERGERGERDQLIETLLRELTGCEAATVVNNNAAATLLALAALAKSKEVIVSRGELVEIGGSYRIPEIMRAAGCKLKEVGTTNRTHLADYEEAIGPKSALLLKVHTSNYQVEGFTAAVAERELARLAHSRELPLMVDLGSGALTDLSRFGLPREPLPQDCLRDGADVVTFSCDKLLGGPQAGIILGRADLLKRIRKSPLRRALRVGKITLAALEAVLRLYRDPDTLAQRLPTLRLLTRAMQEIEAAAQRLHQTLATALAPHFEVDVAPCKSQIGSGALPVDLLPSFALRATPLSGGKRGAGTALKALEKALRALPKPVIGRVQDQALWLDLRCLDDESAFSAQLAHLQIAPTS
jgi:L-seryl-tRNA(Ser) seleniumtransferase